MKKPKKKRNFGTKEWAQTNFNFQEGCEHNCAYCYAKRAAERFGRRSFENWASPVINKQKAAQGFKRRDGRIMFPSSHDITENNAETASCILRKMLIAGNQVLVVSKPHQAAVRLLCDASSGFEGRVEFRFTITSANNAVLAEWEPNAPTFEERAAALKDAHARGFTTSVSIEPYLDWHPEAVIKACLPFISGTVWLGVMSKATTPMEARGRFQGSLYSSQALSIIIPACKLAAGEKLRLKESIHKVLDISHFKAQKRLLIAGENR